MSSNGNAAEHAPLPASPSKAKAKSPSASPRKRKVAEEPDQAPAAAPQPQAIGDVKVIDAFAANLEGVLSGVNRTLGTQADQSLNGIPASKCIPLSAYIRMNKDARLINDKSIQKPKKLSMEDWLAVQIPDRTLWLIWRKNLKDAKLDSSDFPWEEFRKFVAEEEEALQEFMKSREEKLKRLEDSNNQKIGRYTKSIDRKLRDRLKNASDAKRTIRGGDPAPAGTVLRVASNDSPTKSPKKTKASPSTAPKAAAPVTPTI